MIFRLSMPEVLVEPITELTSLVGNEHLQGTVSAYNLCEEPGYFSCMLGWNAFRFGPVGQVIRQDDYVPVATLAGRQRTY